MKTISLTVQANQTGLPNKMHLSAQQTYRATVFTDRKKRAKNGYQKHKNAEW